MGAHVANGPFDLPFLDGDRQRDRPMTEVPSCSVTLTLASHGNVPTASLVGEFDASCSRPIEEILVDALAAHRIGCIDLQCLQFMDVAGATSLHTAVQRLAERGTTVRVAHVNRWQRRLICWCGWEYLLDGSQYPKDRAAIEHQGPLK